MARSNLRLEKMRIAAEIASHIVDIVPEFLKPGMTEQNVASIIRKHIKKRGGHKESFRMIIASGKRSAMPHGYATKKVIRKNEIVMVDIGVHYDGYCSDITRMYHVGAKCISPIPESDATNKIKKIYNIVKTAQLKAIKMVRSGILVSDIDKAVRKEFKKYGLEKYFTHSTGHGIGKMVHEEPRISHKNTKGEILETGQVITIEPGLYFKDEFGIRIEDMILVKKKGYEILTETIS